MAATHKVQSYRAVVEQTFADLKRWKALEGNKVSSVADQEKVLDAISALHNLDVLYKRDPFYQIPRRRNPVEGEHIFGPLERDFDAMLKIPRPARVSDEEASPHVIAFKNWLPTAVPAVRRAIDRTSPDCAFYPTVLKRGLNLYQGAYVLQLQVQDEGLGMWTVKYVVGASYSYETHVGYFQMTQDNAAANHICDCYAG